MASVVNLYLTYRLLKLLTSPFKDWKAYKMGIIDQKGEKIKNPVTNIEKESFGMFEKIVLKIKKIFTNVMGQSRAAAALAALYLIKEEKEAYNIILKYLCENYKDFNQYMLEESKMKKEQTIVGDIASFSLPMRSPDKKGPYGVPSFTTEKEEIGKIINGKKKFERWDKYLKDEGIKNWAKKNPLKNFCICQNGVHFQVR